MLRSIWTKTLWDARFGLVGWAVALALTTLVYAAFYPSFTDEAMAQALAAYPEALMRAFGWTDLTSAAGYLGSTVFGLLAPILLLVYAIGLGGRAVAGEEESGALDLLLAHPVSRTRAVLERTLAIVIALALVSLVVFVALVAVRGAAELTAIPVSHLAAATLQLALLGVTVGTLALAVGALTGSRALAVSVAAAVAVLGYFANTLAAQLDATAWLRHLSVFRYYAGAEVLRSGLDPLLTLVLVLVSAACTAIAVVGLGRRDVAV
jgi:ABC-2 type transport system permease protein